MSQRKKEALTNGTAPDSTTGKYHFIERLLPPCKWLTFGAVIMSLLGLGVMAQNGWLDGRNRLFGKVTEPSQSPQTAVRNTTSGSALSPVPAPPSAPTSATPQLSKEYVYAGSSRLLAVEDAGATNAPPADLAVWRSTSGTWYILGNGSSSQNATQQWGGSADLPAPGDFDGDGKTDFCVFRPATGQWFVLKSADNTLLGYDFGQNGDLPVVADYDGDGLADFALWRASNQNWYRVSSASGQPLPAVLFGNATDTPVPADYDGDGKADIAVRRDAAAQFFVLQTTNNQTVTTSFGASGDLPVTGDFDGDGKFDFATWRGSDNIWRILQSSNSQVMTKSWGNRATDRAVPGDYDGDGKTDIAVWTESGEQAGLWQIWQSRSQTLRGAQWGTTGDIPVPAPYRR